MKKAITLVLALVMLLCICACGSTTETASEPAAETGTNSAQQSDAAAEPAKADEVYTLVFTFSDPEGNNQYTDIFKPFFDKITEETDGRVQFECHFNGELVSLSEAYDAAVKGIVDIAYIRSGSLPYCPFESLLENPPITGKECTRSSYIMNQLFDEYPELGAGYTGVKFLFRYQMYYGYIGTTKDAIESFDDLKGKTMIVGSALAASRAQAFGATPLDVLPPDFYTSLEKGLADGALTVTQPEMVSFSWADVIGNVTMLPVIKATAGLVINEDTWNSLPADIQEAIENAIPEAIELADQAAHNCSVAAIETLEAGGTNYIEPDEEFVNAVKAADEVVIQAYIDELEADGLTNAGEIYARYLELYNEYSE